jgi:putative SOS response-associated peptidase YedK
MCGRFTNRFTWSELVRLYRLTESDIRPQSNFPARYNIAPTQTVPVVRLKDGKREVAFPNWGLIPSFATEPAGAAKLINARCETIAEKAAFKSAFVRRRCLVIADGFYEWKKLGPKDKQPYFITLKDNAPFAFGGLWEWCKPGNGSGILETCPIITVPANDLVQPLHDRMPAILAPEHWDKWLGEELQIPDQLKALLKPFPSDRMACWPVSKSVGNVANDEPSLIEPLRTAAL